MDVNYYFLILLLLSFIHETNEKKIVINSCNLQRKCIKVIIIHCYCSYFFNFGSYNCSIKPCFNDSNFYDLLKNVSIYKILILFNRIIF